MTVLWSSGVSPDVLRGKNTSAVLVDTGNLVLRDEGGTVWWQSFDYPSDTCIPGMKFRFNLTTGRPRGLISWKNADDPSPGEFSVKLDPQWPYQLLMTNGSSRYWRSTWWNGRLLTFVMGTGRTFASYFTIAADRDEFVLTFSLSDPSVTSRFVMSNSGSINQLTWVEETKSWSKSFSIPSAICHFYAHCGPFGVCNRKKSPECTCLEGFEPRRRDDWRKGNWSSGCARLKALSCNERDAFFKLERMKQPDLPTPLDNLTRTQCESECLRNCSCTAFSYATLGIESSPRCIVWLGNLMDLEENQRVGQEVYIRLVPSEQGGLNGAKHNGRRLVAITVPTLITGVLLGINFGYFFWRLKMRGRRQQENHRLLASVPDVPLFRFSALVTATRNFSTANKLGEGGFGPVYKGKLSKGQEIAVKRLSQCSGQGSVEFRNEVELIGKLQHRNLVRLLGWCIHKEEKILIYEFMPNKSLDKLIFDPTQQGKLDWGKRFRIAQGIAQGLLYLHQHSRLRVIHRDLKPNNILLDAEMNPKISDFGLARIFEGNQTQADTSRVVGTYGYMSPEYALDGRFSEKSDVFSFGVILLELVSGKRSTGFYPLKNSLNLLGYAWLLWRDDRGLELLDPSTQDSFVGEESWKLVLVQQQRKWKNVLLMSLKKMRIISLKVL
ncbi:hypothetical protein H6P81_007260 [Aristolochia fimbriata]|uniref:non-specific serine/threonine protein kinase n=1 Tax=Aristolochia fimbriata TaxID=158543 RepID=A0AAV7F0W0_ARIFI|nr:hypothetical protein H6P81_007260 [Aristolochia fimbriata]